jgi:hypothetical protein
MATQAQIDAYKNSQAYRDFQKSMEGGVGTMDMYDSPYFGSSGSGSQGRAQDKSFEDWLAANPNAGSTTGGGNKSATGGADTTALDPSQSTLSPNFSSYIYDMLGKGQGLASLPYQEYTGQRFAGPSALQRQAFQGLGSLQLPDQYRQATNFLTRAGRQAGRFNYTPQNVYAPYLQNYQMEAPQNVAGERAQAAQLGVTPQAQAAQFQGPGSIGFERVGAERVNAPNVQNLSMQAETTGYRPNLQTFQMGPAERVSAQGFDTASAQNLMSPYMRGVVDIQKREAQRQADKNTAQRGAKFAQSGAFGGARQAIENAEAQRNLSTQMGDIEAQGLQSAYQQAQQQFNTQQQQSLAAQQANQQAGLTTGQQNLAAQLGVQNLGAGQNLQTELANLGNRQQANLQNLSAGLQTQGLQAQTGMQAQQLNQATGLQALLANQQAGINTGQINAQQAYNTALQNAQMRQQAELANQGLMGQYGLQQGQFNQAAAMQNPQFAQQANLANQQMRFNTGQQNLNAMLGIQSLGAGQNLQAQLANQQAGQYGANLGLQANQQMLGAGQALGGLGTQQFGSQLQGLQSLLNAGQTQQGFNQQPLDFGYQQFQESMKYPYQQATFMQSLLQGLPLQARPYDSGQSGLASALQGGLSGLALYNAMNPTPR